MFYRYGSQIFNLRNVQKIYTYESLFGGKYILRIKFKSIYGNLNWINNTYEDLEFKDEYTMMKEFNKICKIFDNSTTS